MLANGTLYVSATSGGQIGLTPEVGGCARLNHRLTSVVHGFLATRIDMFDSFSQVLSWVTRETTCLNSWWMHHSVVREPGR